jgi:hypothetical protein
MPDDGHIRISLGGERCFFVSNQLVQYVNLAMRSAQALPKFRAGILSQGLGLAAFEFRCMFELMNGKTFLSFLNQNPLFHHSPSPPRHSHLSSLAAHNGFN